MSAFNTVIGEAVCPVCKYPGMFEVQFKYGATWQYTYRIGDSLRWGRNDIGRRDARRVVVEGVGGPCPNCGNEFIDFDVLIENNIVVGLRAVETPRTTTYPEGYVIADERD
jgi:hypothetical protein